MLFWYFPSGKDWRRWQKLFGRHVCVLCVKCCSTLLTLPGAHPVCEIFNMRIVPLCLDEMMMIHSFWNVLYILFIWFFFFDYSLKNGMHQFFFFGWFWGRANWIYCVERISPKSQPHTYLWMNHNLIRIWITDDLLQTILISPSDVTGYPP